MSQQPTARSRAPTVVNKRPISNENTTSTQVTFVKDAMSTLLAAKARPGANSNVLAAKKRTLVEKTINTNNALNVQPLALDKENASNSTKSVVAKAKPAVALIKKAAAAPAPVARKVLQEKIINTWEPSAIPVKQEYKVEVISAQEVAPAASRTIVKRALAPVKPETVAQHAVYQDDAQLYEEEENRKRPKRDEYVQWDDLDAEDEFDPLMVSEYVVEIFEYMQHLEIATMPDSTYIMRQKGIDWMMRSTLIDWLAEVHHKFKLLPETLFLSVNVIDRFLSRRSVSKAKLQLVGMTALFIAAKYEEVMAPSVENYVYMANGLFKDREMLQAERYMLQVLGFELSFPNPMNFLRRISKADRYDIHSRTVAKYLMEMPLLDHHFLECTPSMVASSALCLARRMLGQLDWNPNLIHYSGGYTLQDLEPCMERMIYQLRQASAQSSFVFKKYATRRFMKASIFVREWIHSLDDRQ